MAFKPLFIPLILFLALSSLNCGTTKKTTTVIDDDRLSIQRDKLINYAKTFIGTKYKYAGNTPEEGFDCSGFVKYVFHQFGYELPRRSADYSSIGKKTELNDCMKADILLFTGSDKTNREVGHVAIVVSNDTGDIQFIHASTSRGVVISDMKVTYYKERILGAVRIIY
jgi:murein DD-endopeptidase / murein LD-carboxypeptidase